MLGVRDDVPGLLVASDLMVLTSLEEGLPNVILEGMAAGLPVIATAVGGNPELVVDGVTGILIQSGDPNALAEGILRLETDRALAASMGRQGQERVETEFTAAQTTARYIELFEELLAYKDR
jgi:glycosyltransferase involved in cell wall biosynthesis